MAPKMTQNELPEASGDPLGTPWAPGGCQDAIKIDPGALLEASGDQKNSLVFAGGPPEKFWGHFSTSLRRPKRDFGLHFASPGEFPRGPFYIFPKNTKTLDFEYLPYENHDFRRSGGSFW